MKLLIMHLPRQEVEGPTRLPLVSPSATRTPAHIRKTAVTSQTTGCRWEGGVATGNDILSRTLNMINAPKLPI
jgi:hypothetical protein